MKIFLDTSSLIKLYHNEIGTDLMDKIFDDYVIDEIFLSDIAKIEFSSAIWKKVRTTDLNFDEANDIINSFHEDFGKYTFIEIDVDLISTAYELLKKHGIKGLRTLDSIQLASILKIRSNIFYAITADNLLKSLIEIEGFETL